MPQKLARFETRCTHGSLETAIEARRQAADRTELLLLVVVVNQLKTAMTI